MSHSHNKHRRKAEDEKYFSRSNVFERLGEDKKDEDDWQSHHSKSSKTRRSNVDVMMDRDISDRKATRWPSSSREKTRSDQPSSSKPMKSQDKGFHSEYSQEQPRRDYSSRHQIQDVDVLPVKKSRSAAVEHFNDDYERGRKKRERSVSSGSSSSVSPPRYSSRHDHKKLPSIEKDYERGRSKDKKSRKLKESVKHKEPARKAKPSKQHESFKEAESPDYDITTSDYRHKKRRGVDDEYEQTKHSKDARMVQYRKDDVKSTSASSKKVRDMIHREDTDTSSIEGKHRHKGESGKSGRQQQKFQKEEEYEGPPKSHKKVKSHKVEGYEAEVPKPKKKAKAEKDERIPQYSKQHAKSQDLQKKKNKEMYSDSESSNEGSLTPPPRHKSKERKHYKNEYYSDESDDEVTEKKAKSKKKKKQKILEEVEPVKKKKLKHKANDPPHSRRRNPDQHEPEEVKEKLKKPKKKKRVREESVSSQSEGEIKEPVKQKTHSRAGAERADDLWPPMDRPGESQSRDYRKHDDYDSSKSRQSVVVSEPQRKRPKLERMRRGDSPESSSRSDSRVRHSPHLPQQGKRQRDHSADHDSYDSHLRDDKRVRGDERLHHEHRVHEPQVHARDRGYTEPKSEQRRVDKYGQPREEARYKDDSTEDKKPYYDDKKAPRYYKKALDPPYDDKHSYDGRNQDVRGNNDQVRYDSGGRRETRRDAYDNSRREEYDVEPRKSRSDFRGQEDSRHRSDPLHKQEAYPPRSSEFREFAESHSSEWQSHRGRKPKEGGSSFSNEPHRVSSWVDSRDGGKLRIETRDTQSYRKSRDASRMEDQRNDKPDQRGGRIDQRGDRMDQRGDRMGQRGDRMDQRGDRMDQRGDRMDQRGDRMDQRGDRLDQRGDRLDQRGDGMDQRGDRRDQRGDRMDRRNERMDQKSGSIDQRGDRVDDRIDQRYVRHDIRGERQYDRDPRADSRNQSRDKWSLDRPPVDSADPRRQGKIFTDDKSSSRNRSGQFQEGLDSPAFYREVRRSGESRHLDVGIEVTIHDDGGRSSVDYEKTRKHRGSPARKVSSYDTSRPREGGGNKPPSERSISLHRDKSSSETARPERQTSSYRDAPPASYPPHRGGEGMLHGREQQRGGDKQISSGRGNMTKYIKTDRGRAVERDQSRGSSAPDYQRDMSSSSRDRSRGTPRDGRHSYQRKEKSDRNSSKTRKDRESSKSSSERSRKRSKSSSRKNDTKNRREKEKSEPEVMDVLDVDWTELSSDQTKPVSSQSGAGSILGRFAPGNLLIGMGVSGKLLPSELLEKVKIKCQEETDSDPESTRLVLDRGLGALNRAQSLRHTAWRKIFTSPTARLTSYNDARYRKNILGITEDLRFPPQPPMIINAKSYSSSMKHYLSKTKASAEGG